MKETELIHITSYSYSSCFSCFVFSYPSCHCGLVDLAVLAFTGFAEEPIASVDSAKELVASTSSAEGLEASTDFIVVLVS